MFILDLLPIEPLLLPFFDAWCDSILSFDKTYKKERGTSLALCSRSKINVVVLLSKKGDGSGSASRSKPLVK